jgi:hypothetical protein
VPRLLTARLLLPDLYLICNSRALPKSKYQKKWQTRSSDLQALATLNIKMQGLPPTVCSSSACRLTSRNRLASHERERGGDQIICDKE